MDREKTSRIIRYAMVLNNKSKVDLARMTGIPKASISNYVSGDTAPSEDRWTAIKAALNIPYVLEEDGKFQCDMDLNFHNRGLFCDMEVEKRRERLQAWVKLFLACGYSLENIKEYVDEFYDMEIAKVIQEASNDYKAACFLSK